MVSENVVIDTAIHFILCKVIYLYGLRSFQMVIKRGCDFINKPLHHGISVS